MLGNGAAAATANVVGVAVGAVRSVGVHDVPASLDVASVARVVVRAGVAVRHRVSSYRAEGF